MEDINKANIDLCEAIQSCDLVKVKEALEAGAKPHARIDYNNYYTPWTRVYSCRKPSIILYLLEKGGAEVNTRLAEIFDQTLIFGAILNADEDSIRILAAEGADLNIIYDDGYTPLYSILGQPEECLNLVPVLLKLGADMRVGIRKLDQYKKDDPESFEKFCEQVIRFLEESDKKLDYKVLEKQLPKILEVKQHLPENLVAKAQELEKDYCQSDDDSNDDYII